MSNEDEIVQVLCQENKISLDSIRRGLESSLKFHWIGFPWQKEVVDVISEIVYEHFLEFGRNKTISALERSFEHKPLWLFGSEAKNTEFGKMPVWSSEFDRESFKKLVRAELYGHKNRDECRLLGRRSKGPAKELNPATSGREFSENCDKDSQRKI